MVVVVVEDKVIRSERKEGRNDRDCDCDCNCACIIGFGIPYNACIHSISVGFGIRKCPTIKAPIDYRDNYFYPGTGGTRNEVTKQHQ